MNFFQKNLEVLHRKYPDIELKLTNHHILPGEAEIIDTPSGKPSAVLDGSYIHSRYDPQKEAQRLIKQEAKPESSLAIFYGFGLGYLVEAFYHQFADIPMVVIESDLSLFIKALQARDLTQLLSSSLISWFLEEEPERIVMKIGQMPLAGAQIIRLRSLLSKNKPYFQKLDLLLKSSSDRRDININTLSRFGRLWVRNLLKNLEPFITSPGILQLKDLFQGIPALVLSAGPSIDQILPYLKELKKRLLLIAVDTSLRVCLEQGIEPDFLVIVDPQYWNTRHLDWTAPKSPVLISESSTHPRVFRLLGGRGLKSFFISSFFPLGEFLESIIGQKGRVGAGGSVSTTAWDFTRLIAARPIFMAGLDLGFPGKKTHSRGSFFEERMHLLSCRLSPVEGLIFRYLHEAGPFLTPSNRSSPCYTDRRMTIYKWWFENQLQQYGPDKVKSFNLAAQGVKIEGMPYAELDRLFRLPKIRAEIDRRLKQTRALLPAEASELEQRRSSIGLALTRLNEELETLEAISAEALKVCADLKPFPNRAGKQVSERLSELNQLDQKIIELSSRQVAGFLFQPLIQKISQSGGGNTLSEVLESSEAIYRELQHSCSYHIELIRTALNRLKSLKL